jgi:hypothetical protein
MDNSQFPNAMQDQPSIFRRSPCRFKRLIGPHNYTRGQIERGQSEALGLCAQKGLFLRKKALAGT